MICDPCTEVAIFSSVGRAVRFDLQITPHFTYADEFDDIIVGRGFIAKKSFFKANLRLGAKIVMQSGKNDDDLIASISGLAYQTCVVSCFSRLDVAYN